MKQTNRNIATPMDMDPADRALVQSYVEKYINTGVKPTDKDKSKMLELTAKYKIKINSNPRPIISRFRKIRVNKIDSNNKPIPYEAAPGRILSKGAVKKQAARDRKAKNRAAH